jgi:preprotein translocase subunit YajC
MRCFLNMFPLIFVSGLAWSAGRMPGGSESQSPAAPYGGFLAIVPWLLIFGVFYFLLIRPQQKQAKERQAMLDALKRGDSVLTQGGFYGIVAGIKGSVVEIKLNEEVKVKVDKAAITRIFRDGNDPAK